MIATRGRLLTDAVTPFYFTDETTAKLLEIAESSEAAGGVHDVVTRARQYAVKHGNPLSPA